MIKPRSRLLGVALFLCVSTAALSLAADYPWASLAYDHGYFIHNDDPASDEWCSTEVVAWARWNFWFMSEVNTVFPIQMDLESNISIDETIWHVPNFLSSSATDSTASYSWLFGRDPGGGGDSPCFSLAVA